MLFVILFLIFVSIGLLCYAAVPLIVARTSALNKQQAQNLVGKVDRYLGDEDLKKAYRLTIIGPIALGVAGFALSPDQVRFAGLIFGAIVGFVLPRVYVQKLIETRKRKFNDQLMDALMIMSSSFRGGLSLIQAVEAVVDEMPDPCKAEFGIVLGENKMGVALDESLLRLYKRMPSAA